MERFVKISARLMSGIFLVIAAAFMLMRMFGVIPYSVSSDSMEPAYRKGSLVFVRKTPCKSIKEGDIISYLSDINLNVSTQRVVSVSDDGKYFYTKGDAEIAERSTPVYYKNILGKTVFAVPWLGYISMWISSSIGKACTVILLVGLLALSAAGRLLSVQNLSGEKGKAVGVQ